MCEDLLESIGNIKLELQVSVECDEIGPRRLVNLTRFKHLHLLNLGRENDTDCQPQEQAQQWYDWQGHDKGKDLLT